MNEIAVIGAGRLGTALASALKKKGFFVRAVSCRHFSSARKSVRLIGQGKPSADVVGTAEKGTMVFLTVPDDSLPDVVRKLSRSSVEWRGKPIFHCSGLLPSSILDPLKKKGASTGSLHPVQTFPKKDADPGVFEGVYFGFEGGKTARRIAEGVVKALGGHIFILEPDDKPLYHAACSFASNFFVVLLDTAVSMLNQIGFDRRQASRVLMPLVQKTLQNIKNLDIEEAQSGPFVRGDAETIKAHLAALAGLPKIRNAYENMAALARELAGKQK